MRNSTYKFVVKREGRIIYRGICFDLNKVGCAWKSQFSDCQVIQVGKKTTIDAAIKWEKKHERLAEQKEMKYEDSICNP